MTDPRIKDRTLVMPPPCRVRIEIAPPGYGLWASLGFTRYIADCECGFLRGSATHPFKGDAVAMGERHLKRMDALRKAGSGYVRVDA